MWFIKKTFVIMTLQVAIPRYEGVTLELGFLPKFSPSKQFKAISQSKREGEIYFHSLLVYN